MEKLTTKVQIIESPSPRDLLGNQKEGDALLSALRLGGIEAQVRTVVNRETLAIAILEITKEWEEHHLVPSLHISAHGNAEGIAFTDKNEPVLKWEELGDALEPLSEKLGGYLVVCMSACNGVHGSNMAQRIKHPVFSLLVGTPSVVHWSDALVAYITFYHHVLLKDATFDAAVTAMNVAAGLPDETFQLVHGEDVRNSYIGIEDLVQT